MEWLLLCGAGILGSSHCLGMCGPFALAIGGAAGDLRSNLLRQSVYTLGRLFTYSVLGALAGFCGLWLAGQLPTLVNVPAILALAAGVLLVWQGLLAAGVVSQRFAGGKVGACLGGAFFGSFLRQPGMTGVFLAGLFTGLLPCGLLYGMLALAAATRNPLLGAATMLAFGLGTAPLMVATGLGGSLLSLAARKRLYVAAAWCLVLTGAISVVRGASFLNLRADEPIAEACPLCQAAAAKAAAAQNR